MGEKYQTVTIETYHGGIVDENMVNSGDRLKVKRAVSDYETRTVDNKYGAGHDVTAISVKDAFTTVGSDLLNPTPTLGSTTAAPPRCSSAAAAASATAPPARATAPRGTWAWPAGSRPPPSRKYDVVGLCAQNQP